MLNKDTKWCRLEFDICWTLACYGCFASSWRNLSKDSEWTDQSRKMEPTLVLRNSSWYISDLWPFFLKPTKVKVTHFQSVFMFPKWHCMWIAFSQLRLVPKMKIADTWFSLCSFCIPSCLLFALAPCSVENAKAESQKMSRAKSIQCQGNISDAGKVTIAW